MESPGHGGRTKGSPVPVGGTSVTREQGGHVTAMK